METLPKPRSTGYEQVVLDALDPDNKLPTPETTSEQGSFQPEFGSDFDRLEEFRNLLGMLATRGAFRGVNARVFVARVDAPPRVTSPNATQTTREETLDKAPEYSPDTLHAIGIIDGELAQVDQNDPEARKNAIDKAERHLYVKERYHPDIAEQSGKSEEGVLDVKNTLHDARRGIGPFASK